jgi:hypothetical protein
MKDFLQICSNQITTFNPIEKHFTLKSEIIISAFQSEYHLAKQEEGQVGIAKVPTVETFRFLADANELRAIRDRINEELKLQKKMAKEHSIEHKY